MQKIMHIVPLPRSRNCIDFVNIFVPYTLGIMNFVPPPGGEQQIADLGSPGGSLVPAPIHFHFTE